MANRVLSIKIGYGITKVLEMDYKVKNPKVYNCFTIENPEDMMEDGKVKQNDEFRMQLKNALQKYKIKTRKVVFTITSGRIANREVTIPLVKEKGITNLLMANSTEYFPVDLSQYQLVHRILEKTDTKEVKQYKLAVWAVPNDLVQSYERLAAFCGLTLVALDYVGNSIIQIMKKNGMEDDTAVIKIEENSSMVTILKDGKTDLQRSLSYGIEEAIETVRNSDAYGENLSYADALNVLYAKSCIRRNLNVDADYKEEEDTELTIANTRAEVTESLRLLIGNITRVLDYYVSMKGDADIRRIHLIGSGADCVGIDKLLTNELGIKVVPLPPIPNVSISKKIDRSVFRMAGFAACIGAALDPLNFSLGEKRAAAGKGGAASGESLALAGFVFAACIVAAAGMTFFALSRYMSLQAKNKELTSRIDELQPIQKLYDTYEERKSEYEDTILMYAFTLTPSDKLLEFLKEMETNMPVGIIVENLSADTEGVNMSISMPSKEAVAEALVQLRDFNTLSSVTTTGIKEETDELGVTKVTFVVSCTFALADSDTETESTGSPQ